MSPLTGVKVNRIEISIAFCILLLSLLLLGSASAPQPPPPPTEGSLALSDSPVLGKHVEVIYTFWLSDKIKWDKFSSTGSINVTANIKLSNKFQLVNGNLQWQGNLIPRQKAEIKATIKAIKKGTGEISASTNVSAYYDSGNRNTLFFLVLTDRAFWGNEWSDLPGEDWAKRPNIVSVLTGCRRPNVVAPATSISTTDEIVIFPRLTFPHPPSLGKTAELTLVASAYMDAPGARISVALPKEVELVSGNLQWNGYMAKGDEIELKALVKATKVGKWTFATQIDYSPNPKSRKYLPSNYLTLYVFKDGADTVEGPLIKAIPKVNIELSLSNLPDLHKRTELTFLVVALNHDLPKAKVTIYLPLGFQLINGNPYWEGDMKKGTPIEIQMTIEPIVKGTFQLMVVVDTFDEDREIYSGVTDKRIYVQVTED